MLDHYAFIPAYSKTYELAGDVVMRIRASLDYRNKNIPAIVRNEVPELSI